jgi:hypothetical protein
VVLLGCFAAAVHATHLHCTMASRVLTDKGEKSGLVENKFLSFRTINPRVHCRAAQENLFNALPIKTPFLMPFLGIKLMHRVLLNENRLTQNSAINRTCG